MYLVLYLMVLSNRWVIWVWTNGLCLRQVPKGSGKCCYNGGKTEVEFPVIWGLHRTSNVFNNSFPDTTNTR